MYSEGSAAARPTVTLFAVRHCVGRPRDTAARSRVFTSKVFLSMDHAYFYEVDNGFEDVEDVYERK